MVTSFNRYLNINNTALIIEKPHYLTIFSEAKFSQDARLLITPAVLSKINVISSGPMQLIQL